MDYKEFLKHGERLDDLQINNLQVIQNPAGFCFSEDAVLLANFVKIKAGERVCDLGTGCGVIAILLSAKTQAKEIVGVEIQADIADMAARSVKLNDLENRVNILNLPMQEAHLTLGREGFDAVAANPPFFQMTNDKGQMTNNDIGFVNSESIAKQEIYITLDEVATAAARLLRFRGRFYLIHRADRLADVFRALNAHDLEPKVLRFCGAGKTPDRILVEAVKGGKPGLRVQMTNDKGQMTSKVN